MHHISVKLKLESSIV